MLRPGISVVVPVYNGAGTLLAYVLVRYMIQGSPVQGFPFLASIISIFSGTQLFVLGIIGEYLEPG